MFKFVQVLAVLAVILHTVAYAQTGCGGLYGELADSWQCIYAMGLIGTAYQFKDNNQCPTQVDLENCFTSAENSFKAYYAGSCHCQPTITNAAFTMVQADYVDPAFVATKTNQSSELVSGAFAQGFLGRKRSLKQATHYYKYCTQQYYSAFTSVFGISLFNAASTKCPDAGQAKIKLIPGVPQAKPPVVKDNAVPIHNLPGVLLPEAWVDAGVAKDTREARLKNISEGSQIDNVPMNMADYDRQGPQAMSSAQNMVYSTVAAFTIFLFLFQLVF